MTTLSGTPEYLQDGAPDIGFAGFDPLIRIRHPAGPGKSSARDNM
jgi:hypothetical protein